MEIKNSLGLNILELTKIGFKIEISPSSTGCMSIVISKEISKKMYEHEYRLDHRLIESSFMTIDQLITRFLNSAAQEILYRGENSHC